MCIDPNYATREMRHALEEIKKGFKITNCQQRRQLGVSLCVADKRSDWLASCTFCAAFVVNVVNDVVGVKIFERVPFAMHLALGILLANMFIHGRFLVAKWMVERHEATCLHCKEADDNAERQFIKERENKEAQGIMQQATQVNVMV